MRHLKQEFDKLSMKETLMYGLTIITMMAGLVLLFMGMLLPPEGEIHSSVLTAFGIILVFCAAVFGLDLRYADKMREFKDSITTHVANAIRDINNTKPNLDKDRQP